MTSPTISLIDRAGLDRDDVRRHLGHGLQGADDGELFLEYCQSEMLGFDNGRLKQAPYDTSQGFGLRAVKDEAVGYAHASDLSEPALARAAEAVRAVKGGYSGHYAEPPGRTNVRLYGDDNPLGAPSFETKVRLLETIDAYARAKDPRVRQVTVSFGTSWQVGEILRADGDTTVLQRADGIGQINIRRKNHDVDRPFGLETHLQFGEQCLIGGPRAVHLPITRDHLTTHRLPSGICPAGKAAKISCAAG